MSSSKDTFVNIDGNNDGWPVIGEKPRVTITETEMSRSQGTSPLRPPIVQRRTTMSNFRAAFEDDNLTAIGHALYKLLKHPGIRYCIYVLPVAALLAIPVILFTTKYRATTVGGIHLFGLFVWLEVIWVLLWVSKLIASAFPYIFQGICGLVSTGVRKYALVLKAVEIPMSLFIWTIFTLASLSIIWAWDKDFYNAHYHAKTGSNIHWLHVLSNVCRGSIGSSALYLFEKMMMQIISVSYHGKQHADKIKDIKMTSRAIDLLYNASLKQYHDHHPDFLEEDYDIHDSTNLQKLLKQTGADKTTMHLFGDMHYFGEKLVSIFGRMASDITGTQVFRPTATHAIVESALERKAGAEALAKRIFKSLVQPGADAISESDIVRELGAGSEEEASFIFAQLDRDGNGDVSLEEMLMLVTGIAKIRKDMWKSACDIKNAIKVLDHVLSFVVFVIIAFIYSAFFSNFLADNWTKILGILSAGAFSFGQTVGEFNAACILVFVKHPFDVGDRVNIDNKEYEVSRISLLYTVFKKVDSDTIVQVANSIVGNLWIDNVSRSKAMKERLTFSVSAATKFSDIELLRAELEAFVRSPDNSRDYQPEIDIQLISVGDLKQLDLRVEIRHKSNWANDTLRATRRSKFMCALLSAMRKVPIDGPGGSAPAQGSINSPNYSVAISQDEATDKRKVFDAEKAASRMPVSEEELQQLAVVSSGLEILPSLRNAVGIRGFGEEGLLRRPSAVTQLNTPGYAPYAPR